MQSLKSWVDGKMNPKIRLTIAKVEVEVELGKKCNHVICVGSYNVLQCVCHISPRWCCAVQISYNTGARMQKTSELNCSDALTIYHLTIHNHITQVSLGTHLTHRRESPHTGVRMGRPHTGVRRHFQIRGCAIQTQ